MRKTFKIAAVVIVVLVLTGLAIVLDGFERLNGEIDRCSDQTSGKYIWDDTRRAAECPDLTRS